MIARSVAEAAAARTATQSVVVVRATPLIGRTLFAPLLCINIATQIEADFVSLFTWKLSAEMLLVDFQL
jgi:hypothetical protein